MGFLFAILPAAGHADDLELKATVREAWKDRQERTKSLRFEWEEEFEMTPAGARMIGVPATAVAEKPLQLPAACRWVLEKDRGRYEEMRDRWSAAQGKMVPQEMINVATGKEFRTLFPVTDSKAPLGNVNLTSDLSALFAPEGAVPISMNYRILHPDFKVFRIDRMSVREETTDKTHTVVATIPVGTSQVELSLSPDQDYIVTRTSFILANGTTAGETKISYKHDDRHGWIPMEWSSKHELGKRHCKVTDYAINREPADGEFELEFPPGTWVNEQPTNISYVIGPRGEKTIMRKPEQKPQKPIEKTTDLPDAA